MTSTTTYTPYSWTSQSYTTYPPNLKVAQTTATTKVAKATVTPGTAYHQIFRQSQSVFDEVSDQASWGYWYYATSNQANLTFQSGSAGDIRNYFVEASYLDNTQDPYYRAINVDWPGFAYAVDLGSVGTTPVSTLFTMNLMQQPVILYENGITNMNQTLNGLWTKYFNSDLDAVCTMYLCSHLLNSLLTPMKVTYFYNDYAAASKLCTKLDNQIKKDSIKAGGANYYTITALAVRQAFGSLQLAANGTGDDFYGTLFT